MTNKVINVEHKYFPSEQLQLTLKFPNEWALLDIVHKKIPMSQTLNITSGTKKHDILNPKPLCV